MPPRLFLSFFHRAATQPAPAPRPCRWKLHSGQYLNIPVVQALRVLVKLHPDCEIQVIVSECAVGFCLEVIAVLLNDLRLSQMDGDLAGGKINICWQRELWRLWCAQPDAFISLTRPNRTRDADLRPATFFAQVGNESCLAHGQFGHLSQRSGNPGSLGISSGALVGGEVAPLSCNSPVCVCAHPCAHTHIHTHTPLPSQQLPSIYLTYWFPPKSLLNRRLHGLKGKRLFKNNQSRSWVKTDLFFMPTEGKNTYKLQFLQQIWGMLCVSHGPSAA